MLKTFISNIINELQGQDIVCLDVRNKINITDVMIICTGTSNQHVISITHNILLKFKNMQLKPYGIEGIETGEWVLIDLGDIVIHIMQRANRKLYALEQLWG